jgi:hypothetical protein
MKPTKKSSKRSLSKGTKKESEAQLRRNERKWTKRLMSAGFTVFPYVILDRQDAIGLVQSR